MPPSVFTTKNNRGRRFIFGEIGHGLLILLHENAALQRMPICACGLGPGGLNQCRLNTVRAEHCGLENVAPALERYAIRM